MEAAGRSFGANTSGLREASTDARLRIELISSSFRERTGELMNAVSQAATRMAAIGETFERQARELNTVSTDSHTRPDRRGGRALPGRARCSPTPASAA